MNPVFLLLVILGGGLLWVSINFLFPIIGAIFYKIYRDTQKNIQKESNEEIEE